MTKNYYKTTLTIQIFFVRNKCNLIKFDINLMTETLNNKTIFSVSKNNEWAMSAVCWNSMI